MHLLNPCKIRIVVSLLIVLKMSVELNGQIGHTQNSHLRDCNIVTNGNQTIMPGESVQLWASGADFYLWSPATGLSSTTVPDPIASPSVTTTYTVTGYSAGDNLVYNGDFELGNVGFTSDYTYQSNVSPSATYYIGANAHDYHPNFYGYDHTTGNGNFMIINGAENLNNVVWSQTVNVIPNTDYAFSTWVCTLSPYSEQYITRLQFCINGEQIGDVFRAPLNINVWENFYQIWNSGNSMQATITILNQNTLAVGNDFGLDDISFNNLEECVSTAQLTVYVGEVIVVGDIQPPLAICEGGSFALTVPQVSGATGWTGVWQIAPSENGPFTTLNNNSIPSSYNGYYLRYAVTYNGNVYYSNVVQVIVTAIPVATINADEESICEGESVNLHAEASGGGSGSYNGVCIGDIICTDGSVEKPSDWPVSGKTANGIVVYVDATNIHGWAVGLNDLGTTKWCQQQTDVAGLTNYDNARSAIYDFDGYGNTQTIRAVGNQTVFPAAWMVDFENGWYLPAIGQWRYMYPYLYTINASLAAVNGTQFPVSTTWWYWSSTESTAQLKWDLDSNGYADRHDGATFTWRVRAMCSFSFVRV